MILPVIDQEKLQEAANKAALEGAIREIKDFYENYNSPFRQQIKEQLGKGDHTINLVKLVELVKGQLQSYFENHAQFTSATMVGEIVEKTLSRVIDCPKKQTFQEFLDVIKQQVKEGLSFDDVNSIDVDIRESQHGWLNVTLGVGSMSYDITFHKNHVSSEEKKKPGFKETYDIMSFPHSKNAKNTVTWSTREGTTVQIPINRTIGDDPVLLVIAGMVLTGTDVTFDCGLNGDNYDLDIPEDEHECHC